MKSTIKAILSALGFAFLGLIFVGLAVSKLMKPVMEKDKQRFAFEQAISRADQNCPMSFEMGKGEITGIKLENGFVTYYFTLVPEVFNYWSTRKNDEKVKDGLLMCILSNDSSLQNGETLTDMLIKLGYGIHVILTGDGNNRIDYSANTSELIALRDKYGDNPQEALQYLFAMNLEAERATLPIKIDEGMLITDYKLEDKDLAIIIQVDEQIYSLDIMSGLKDEMKASIIDEGMSDPESKLLFNMCKENNLGLIYRLYGSSSRRNIEIRIPSYELQHAMSTSYQRI